jgi:hypothetical protein
MFLMVVVLTVSSYCCSLHSFLSVYLPISYPLLSVCDKKTPEWNFHYIYCVCYS